MASLLHESLVELFAEHPELLLPAIREQLGIGNGAGADVEVRFRRGESSTSRVPPVRADLGLELHRPGETEPFAAITIEVQLAKDGDKPFSWLLYHAGQHYRLRIPAFLLVVATDPEVAAWAAGPFSSGMVVMRPLVIGPGYVQPITDPAEAKASLARTLLSGIVHASEPVALDIGLALAAAIDASPDDDGLYYWDTLLAALGDALRRTLEMQLQDWKPRSEWGRRIYTDAWEKGEAEGKAKGEAEGRAKGEAEGRAKGEAEGRAKGEARGRAASLVDLLEARGLAVDPTIRQRITACTDVAMLGQWLRRAATAVSTDEIFASSP